MSVDSTGYIATDRAAIKSWITRFLALFSMFSVGDSGVTPDDLRGSVEIRGST